MQPDSPKVAARRVREKRVVSQMIRLYCKAHHAQEEQDSTWSYTTLCPECAELEAYAHLRTDRCRMMDKKTSCDECIYHCYKPAYRQQIKQVMRYAGPRMLVHHPIAALRHLLGK